MKEREGYEIEKHANVVWSQGRWEGESETKHERILIRSHINNSELIMFSVFVEKKRRIDNHTDKEIEGFNDILLLISRCVRVRGDLL